MRINILINDDILAEAMSISGAATKRAAIETGLRLLTQTARRHEALDNLSGIGWVGDLDALRGAAAVLGTGDKLTPP